MTLIRSFQSSDLKDLAELMSDLGYPTSDDKMKERMEVISKIPTYSTFVSIIKEKVVGMIRDVYYYEEDGIATQISILVTKKAFQGRGIGKSLVYYVEDLALKKGSKILYLTSGIKPERERAHQFYKAIGFEVTGYRFVKKLGTRQVTR